GTALYRCLHIAPLFFMLKIRILELMLHIEQPYAKQPGYKEYWALHDQQSLPPNDPADKDIKCDNRHIGQVRIQSFLASSPLAIEPVFDKKYSNRPNDEHDDRVTIHAIRKLAP